MWPAERRQIEADTRDDAPCLMAPDASRLSVVDLGELGVFLRSHRDRIRPADVGLPAGMRRSVPGLRRAEVARLAGTSPSYYAALEQGTGARPSTQTLAALARALRLDEDGYAHCRRLATRPAPAAGGPASHVPPGLLHLFDGLAATPAHVLTDLHVVLVENRLATLVFSDMDHAGLSRLGQPAAPLHVQNAVVGTLALQRRSLRVQDAGQRLIWYAPVPGTDAREKLRFLAVVGLQDLTCS